VTNGQSGTSAGYISGAAAGVFIGGVGTIVNAGRIKGGTGISVASSSTTTVSNSGTIFGTAGTAVWLGGGWTRLIVAPGAVFQGNLAGGGGKSVLELAATAKFTGGASGAAGQADAYVALGNIVNFTVLQVDPTVTAGAASG